VNPIRQWVDSELKKAETELAALHSRAEKTDGIVHSYDRLARNLDSQQLRYEALQRSAKSAEGSYLLMSGNAKMHASLASLDKKRILNVTVIEPATRSVLPTTSRSFYLLVGAMLAFVLAAGMIVILQHIDNTFRTPRQLEESLQVPVLADCALWTICFLQTPYLRETVHLMSKNFELLEQLKNGNWKPASVYSREPKTQAQALPEPKPRNPCSRRARKLVHRLCFFLVQHALLAGWHSPDWLWRGMYLCNHPQCGSSCLTRRGKCLPA
jgi:hypothetical protein